MSAREVNVVLDFDVSAFTSAMQRIGRQVKAIGRQFGRVGYTAGDRHIERIIRDSAARRLPVDVTARRLMVASDIAAVLDKRSAS